MDVNLHYAYFSILINKPKFIKQASFESDDTNAYEMITQYSDVTAINIVYSDETNELIYVDFNDYNDNYNINQKNKYNEEYEELEVTINKENSMDFLNSEDIK
ncbi:hypothetical protein [Staphylococcus hyicus]|nr:hypothetical protein [Staphylococcus hyicus]SQE47293.1 Uncharacterised protein [Staphylococcus hyicus]